MRPIISLEGRSVKSWVVTSDFERRDNKTYFKLRCGCGNERWASASHIKRGNLAACKCDRKPEPAQKPPKSSTPARKPDKSKPVKAKRGARFHFPEEQCKALVIEWQQTRCDRTFEEILRLVKPLNELLLNRKQIGKFCSDLSDCHQELAIKLFKILPKFNASRGSKLFSYLQCCLSRRVINFAIDSAKSPKFISIDSREDDSGNHFCPGMLALDRVALENWRHGDSADLSTAMDSDEEDPIPQNERAAVNWLWETICPDTASEASAHIVETIQDKFRVSPERSRKIFWAVVTNSRRSQIYRQRRMAKKREREMTLAE